MKIHNIINESQIASEHVKGGLDSYYQLTKAKSLAKADGHDYDKLPEYDRGKDQPHKEKYMALAKEVKEAKGLGKRVKVVKGHFAGEEGTIREIKHGAFKGAPKSYYIDLDNGEMADNLPADVLRLIKRTDEKEKMLTLKDIDNGGKKDVKLTFKRKPDGTPIDKKQPQKEVKEVSDFKKRELEYELRDEEPKSVPSKRRPYRTPQEKIRDAKKRYSKAVGVMKGNTDEATKEKMLTLKDIDHGGKKDVKLTFKRNPDGTPIDKKQPQKEHVKGGLDSYYQLTKAKELAKADGHDYDKLPEYHRGKDQPHKEKYKALATEVADESFDPAGEPSHSDTEFERLYTAYENGGERELAEYLGMSDMELDQEMTEFAMERGLHMDDDRDTVIQGYIEQVIDNAEHKDHGGEEAMAQYEAKDITDLKRRAGII
jgi:hypothetical protein